MRFRQNGFETLRERGLLRELPPAMKSLEKNFNFCARFTLDFGLWTLGLVKREPKMSIFRQTDFRQFAQRATDERRAQHGDARNALQRIVEQLQHAQQIQNLAAVV